MAELEEPIAPAEPAPRKHDPYRTEELAPVVAELREKGRVRAEEMRMARARDLSVIGERFAKRTFLSFAVTPDNSRAAAAARLVANGTLNGLGLTGKVGSGKTHLAAAIANETIAAGRVAICAPTHALLARIRASFSGEGPPEAEQIAAYVDADVLVLDDLGKEPGTRWALDTLFALVDLRYESDRGLVITSNYDPAELVDHYKAIPDSDGFTADAMIDRVLEMTGPWIRVAGPTRYERVSA